MDNFLTHSHSQLVVMLDWDDAAMMCDDRSSWIDSCSVMWSLELCFAVKQIQNKFNLKFKTWICLVAHEIVSLHRNKKIRSHSDSDIQNSKSPLRAPCLDLLP